MKGKTKSIGIVIAFIMTIIMLMSTPANAVSKPSGTYKITDRGNDVKVIQQQLVSLGYMQSKHVTGYFGEITQSAVIKYQKDNNLKTDGIVGKATLSSLFDVKINQNRSYKLEDEGEDVKALQRLLIQKGYLGSKYDTGYFGSLTLEAVKKFQKDHNLKVDGIAGKKTLEKLLNSADSSQKTGSSTTIKTYIAKPGTLRLGDKGKEVADLQKKLKDKGYYKGSATGIFDQATKDAVKAFQKACKISVDGVVGPQTVLHLNKTQTALTNAQSQYTKPDKKALMAAYESMKDSDKADVYLLAQLIHCEARGESYEGQVAVGSVVMNRLSQGYKSIRAVIFAHNGNNYQFSPAKNGKVETVKPNESCLYAAIDAFLGAKPVGKSLYFNMKDKTDTWAARNRTLYRILGCHAFYL